MMHWRTFAAALLLAAAGDGRGRPPATPSRRPGAPRRDLSSAAPREPSPSPAWSTSRSAGTTQTAPIQQTDPEGVPLFRPTSRTSRRARAAVITRENRGHPLKSLRDIPAGEYWVQPFVNVYTRFPRADGHTVWLHMDQWEGQNWKRSPGNLYGEPVEDQFDPASTDADHARRRQGDSADQVPADTDMRQAHQDPERDPHEVVGTADLSRRDGPAAEGLRQASRRAVSRSTTSRDTSRSARRAASAARRPTSTSSGSPTTRRASSTSRCSIRRRTTTTRTA